MTKLMTSIYIYLVSCIMQSDVFQVVILAKLSKQNPSKVSKFHLTVVPCNTILVKQILTKFGIIAFPG